MRLNPNHPLRQDQQAAILEIHVMEQRFDDTANGFHYPPLTLWQTFERHALLIIGGSLVGAALLYLAAFLRGL
jgi:hypothetical protein